MIILPRTMTFARWKVSKAWKRLKVTGVSKRLAGAKISIKVKTGHRWQNTNEKKSIKIALINVFSLNLVQCLHFEINSDRLFRSVR